ncbi:MULTISPECIES: peptidase U32 family protein [Bacillaceae]|uniref:U32 family peptidase n=1 Tax=Bacillus infantis TaxID=324767 RepID=A0A5D4SWH4_9BACI|nr:MULTISPECIES: peptidase U32 family protein [Bacillus]MCA1036331.1 U32 family peptidase [Bacillus infantis]MCP1159886.1 U32 family peptidase [Bacillus infantis]MDT0161987.1 peptidase U32 family protein [Bacillus sp. AG4(2022)]MDW2875714.1 peptidase U32 family protein [Bacillus infantis]TYS66216.1 U32 family peptidase [Bacillus infantis]
MKKPELLVTPTGTEDIIPLAEAGADAFVVGEQRYGLRLAGEFSREQVAEAITLAHSKGKKVYVAMNAIFHNETVDELGDYIRFVQESGADAVIFGDPAVLMAAREAAPDMKLHWNTETTATNWYTCNYWGRKGAKRSVLAREINMDSIIEIKENAEVEIEVQVHGMTAMFQSKRSLLGNYYEYQGKAMKVENRAKEQNMFLHDKERENKYPIFEDANGTHIMSPNDICIIDELQEMVEAGVDSFKIDGILKSADYILEITKLYRKAIDLCTESPEEYEEVKDDLLNAAEEIQPDSRPLDTGFFFKETVY